MKTNLSKSNRWNVHLLLAIVGTTGIAGLFLPFSWYTSPLKAVFYNDLWQLAAPAFLSVLITGAYTRWLISGSFSRAEKSIAYFLSAAMVGVSFSFYFNKNVWPLEFQGWVALIISIVVLIFGAYYLFKTFKKRVSNQCSILIAMQVAYLANCLMCLALFWPPKVDNYGLGGWNVGAYFCLMASFVYLIQIALFFTQKNEITDHALSL